MKAWNSHGQSGSPTYVSWKLMIQRCCNPNFPRYSDWGGRGVTVCDRWRDFRNFFADMGERPKGLTIDRIDGTRGYEPGNCRWATAIEQQAHTRKSILVTLDGQTKPLGAWARELGIPRSTVYIRVLRGATYTEALQPTCKHPKRA